jgi:enoyl-CoA hydratase
MGFVRVEDRGGIALVTLARPPANAFDPDLLADGLAVLDQLLVEKPAAVVITGSGRFFSGGADLRVVPTLSVAEQQEMVGGINRLFSGWHNFPRPVVCAVNGHAVAGGLILALCGDHRVASTSGQFGLTEVKVAIPFPSAAMAVVQAELSPAAARRLVLHGELINSREAASLGIFDEVVADAAVVDRAFDAAVEMSTLPPVAFEIVKQQLRLSSRSASTPGDSPVAGWVTNSEVTEAAQRVLNGGGP